MTFYNGLVLSGGAIKVLSTLGGLQYAYDKDLVSNIKYYTGTSAGALVCYLLIIGYTPSEIVVDACINKKLTEFVMDAHSMVNMTGAMSYFKIHQYLESKTIDRFGFLPTMSELYDKTGKFLSAPTFNMTTGKLEYITPESHPTMPCLVALRMSSSLPLIFERYRYEHCEFVDGAMADYFPLSYTHELIKQHEEKDGHILGYCIELNDSTSDKLLNYVYKILSIPIKHALENELERTANLGHDIIHIDSVSHIMAFNMPTRDKLELFSMGYQNAQKTLELGSRLVIVDENSENSENSEKKENEQTEFEDV